MEPVTQVLDRVFTPSQRQKLRVQQTLRRWSDLVGPEIAAATRVQSLRGDTLFVTTRSAVWTQELTLLKPQILAKLNEAVGEEAIQDIIFRPQRPAKSSARKGGGRKKHPKSTSAPRLTRADREWLSSFAANVEDEQLREVLKQCAQRWLELRKRRRKRKWRECDACRYQNPPGTETCGHCGRSLVLVGR